MRFLKNYFNEKSFLNRREMVLKTGHDHYQRKIKESTKLNLTQLWSKQINKSSC